MISSKFPTFVFLLAHAAFSIPNTPNSARVSVITFMGNIKQEYK